MRSSVLKGVLTLFLTCSAWSSDTKPAILYPSGSTLVNGSAVVRSSALFPGDRVRTETNGIANITLPGSAVLVLSNSEVQFSGAAVNIVRGSMVISTTNGLSAGLGELKISPVERTAKFEVTESGENVLIAARETLPSLMAKGAPSCPQARASPWWIREYKRASCAGGLCYSPETPPSWWQRQPALPQLLSSSKGGASNCPVSPSSPGQSGCR